VLEAICTSETSVLTKTTLRHIPEDGIRHWDKYVCNALVNNELLYSTI
jgi:hypothetical protein